MAQITDYTALIPSENSQKPKFSAMVSLVSGCFVDSINAVQSIESALNIDTAVGAQLDILGLWIGLSRNLQVPYAVFFSFDTTGLGFDEGNWKGAYDPISGLVAMDDETYRQMLQAKIGANNWDGTMSSFRTILNNIFSNQITSHTNPYGENIIADAPFGAIRPFTYQDELICVDNQDMSMSIAFSNKPSALLMAIVSGGYLPLKPAGVLQTFQFPT